ncbi:MAG: glycine betaine ABC transporter substrate-binding protein [Pseudomonadota bacterium]|nr:glycine betaine ABC transporter substrate-binding protein [Pseudomonadota bacterium]
MNKTVTKILVQFCIYLFSLLAPWHLALAQEEQVELVYVEWSSEVVSTNIIKVVLEKLGYEVKIIPVSAAAMWQAVASSDADGLVAAWLDTTHAHYLDAVDKKVINLGPNLEGTKIGLVVPDYVSVNSIEELNQYADKLDNKIIGIDPGAGLMSKTEKAIEEYQLNDFKLIEGSGATMTAALKAAIDSQEWIVVTGWTPHWKFSRWKLKYLEDPKGIYGGEEHISTIVRQGLKEEMPEVYQLLDNFYWTPADMEEVMVWNQEPGADPYENAQRWVKDNKDKVKQWLPEGSTFKQ